MLCLQTNEWCVGLGLTRGWLPGGGRYLLQQPAPVGFLPRVGRGTSRLLHPPGGRCGAGGAVGAGPTEGGGRLAAPRRGELLPSRATRLDFPRQECWGGGVRVAGSCGGVSYGSPSPALAPSPPGRIALRRMPSIRQTLQEMGVKVSDVFPELRQSRHSSSSVGPRNGTAPTLLTNYLDVSLSPPGGLSPRHGPAHPPPPLGPAHCTPRRRGSGLHKPPLLPEL